MEKVFKISSRHVVLGPVLLSVLMTGCASAPLQTRSQLEPPVVGRKVNGLNHVDTENENLDTAQAEAESAESKEKVIRSIISIPAEYNDSVESWIRYFSVKDKERFQRYLDRGEKFRPLIENVLEQNDLPSELYYLAMIESGFNTHAASSAKAKGVWQFMPATGRRYGLEVGPQSDERRDPIRATEAAARYLRDLHNVFGSWHLAMGAYNAGEGRIMNAVFRGKTRNFWELSKKRVLPTETANYVPKVLAALIISRNLTKYGFREPHHEPMPELVAVEVPSPLRFESIASVTGVDINELRNANPHLLGDSTPAHLRSYEVWVPRKKAQNVEAKRGELASYVSRSLRRIAAAPATQHEVKKHIHIVKRGENLGLIATKYKVSTAYLQRINALRSGKIHPGQRLRVTMSEVKTEVASEAATRYRVRRGDNLNTIAKRFGLTVGTIKKRNALKKDRLYVGQILHIETRN